MQTIHQIMIVEKQKPKIKVKTNKTKHSQEAKDFSTKLTKFSRPLWKNILLYYLASVFILVSVRQEKSS